MIDVNYELRKHYYGVLNAMSWSDLTDIPVQTRDSVTSDDLGKDPNFLYIILAGQTDNDSPRAKNSIMHEATITVSVYFGTTSAGGQAPVDHIANRIMQYIIDFDINLGGSLQNIVTAKTFDQTSFLPTDTHKIWVRSMRFRHIISEQ